MQSVTKISTSAHVSYGLMQWFLKVQGAAVGASESWREDEEKKKREKNQISWIFQEKIIIFIILVSFLK